MTTLAVRHTVTDFAGWKAVFDDHAVNRKEHGLLSDTVLRAADDPNTVLILMTWPSPADAQGFLDDPSLREAMARAGVVGAPRIELYEEASI